MTESGYSNFISNLQGLSQRLDWHCTQFADSACKLYNGITDILMPQLYSHLPPV